MLSLRNPVLVALLLLCSGAVVSTQSLPVQSGQATNAAPAAPVARDPFGRESPAGTLFGFLQAAQQRNYKTAGQYLQMKGLNRKLDREDLAVKMAVLMDRAFFGALAALSTEPQGVQQAGVPLDHQVAGKLIAGDLETELVLVRVIEPPGGKVWLISAETVGQIEDLYDQLETRKLEQRLPEFLVENSLFSMPLWQWLALILAAPVAALAAWLLLRFVLLRPRWWSRLGGRPAAAKSPISYPLWLVLGALFHGIITFYLRLPLLQRHNYVRFLVAVLIVGITWLAQRLISRVMGVLYDRALAYGSPESGSLILLSQGMAKGIVFIIAALAMLSVAGFNLTTALAGLGIGGLAVAFAAQKTLENLIGGITLLSDKQMRLGDVYSIGGRVGTVADISPRSTRLRTVERSELSIPNGALATMNLENLSQRDKILLTSKLSVSYDTSAEQLRYVLDELRRMLSEHPKVEASSARVNLAEFGERALNLEFFCYIFTTDLPEFTVIREDILLRMMEIVAQAGSSLVVPSRMLLIGSTPTEQGKDMTGEKVRQWPGDEPPHATAGRASAG